MEDELHGVSILRNKVKQLLSVTLATALFVSGCSSEKQGDNSPADTNNAASYPKTVSSKYGDITVESEPHRIVALEAQSVDLLTSLGITPIAFYGDGDSIESYVTETMPWLEDVNTGELNREIKDAEYSPVPEVVASYNPDLIVSAKGSGIDESTYVQLSKIAPTYIPKDDNAGWIETLGQFGEITGKAEQSENVISEINDKFIKYRNDLPELQGKTLNGAYYTTEGLKLVPNFGWMEDLGLRLAENQPKSGEEAQMLSFENISNFSADVGMIFADQDGQRKLESIPGFNDLRSVDSGAMIYVDRGEVNAAGSPGPSSVAWLMDRIVPRLENIHG